MSKWVVLLLSLFLSDSAQAMMKTGVDKIGGVRLQLGGILDSFLKVLASPYILVGVFFYGLGMMLWLKVLGSHEFIQVMMYSKLHYVFVILISVFYFRETLTPLRCVGMGIILIGVVVFATGEPSIEALHTGQ